MADARFNPGEIVVAAADLYNDGSIPGVAEGVLLAAAGTRGVVVKAGRLEAAPGLEIFAVRFEGPDALLGGPVGCLAEELTQPVADANAEPA